MKNFVVSAIIGALLVAGFYIVLETRPYGSPAPVAEHHAAISELRDQVRALQETSEAQSRRVEDLEVRFGKAEEALSEDAVVQAVKSWLSDNSDALVLTSRKDSGRQGSIAASDGDGTGDGSGSGRLDLGESLDVIFDPDTTRSETQQMWGELQKAGLLDKALTAFEERAQENPENADVQMELGEAYLQKLNTVGDLEKGVWATKADQAFDAALAVNNHHWEARFTKAISLSF